MVLSQASQISDPTERNRYLESVCEGCTEQLVELKSWFNSQSELESPLDIVVSQLHSIARGPISTPPPNMYRSATPSCARSDAETELLDFIHHSENEPSFAPEQLCGTKIGQYELGKVLGRGGMGVVYEARQLLPINRQVAIKLIDIEFSSSFSQAHFEAERKALELMNHPGIAGLLDAGITEWGAPFYVMELVRGEAIHTYCKENKLSLEDRLQLFISLCSAVQHSHQKGIVHRDLKPNNVLVTEWDEKPVVKLIDFGISINTNLHNQQSFEGYPASFLAGTPLYMSPEQASGTLSATDTRSDIYSLGVILFKLLTETTPFSREFLANKSRDEITQILLKIPPPKASDKLKEQKSLYVRKLKYELDWIIDKALAKDPANRYATPLALAEDIENFLRGKVVKAKPPTWQYLSSKWLSNNVPIIVPAIISMVVLTIATIVSMLNLHEARKAQAISKRLLLTADMKLASQAFNDGNFRLARERLERHLPVLEPEFKDSFAWKYLWKRVHPELFSNSSEFKIFGIAYHPTRDEYVTSHDGGELLVWKGDAKVPSRSLRIQDKTIRTVAYSPNGKYMITGNVVGFLCLWDSNESTILASTTLSPADDILNIEWIDDSRVAVVADDLVYIVDINKFIAKSKPININAPLLSNKNPNSTRVRDGKQINNVNSISQGEIVIKKLGPFPGTVYSVAISPRGEQLAVTSKGSSRIHRGLVTLCAIPTWEKLAEIETDFKPLSLAYHPRPESLKRLQSEAPGIKPETSNLLAIGLQSGMVHTAFLYEDQTGNSHRVMSQSHQHTSNIYRLQFSFDGQYLVSASKDATSRIWLPEELQCIQTIQSHLARVYSVCFKPNTYVFLTAGGDAKIRAFDASQLGYRVIVPRPSEEAAPGELSTGLNFLAFVNTAAQSTSQTEMIYAGSLGNNGTVSVRTGEFKRFPFWQVSHISASNNGLVALGHNEGAIVRVQNQGIERVVIDNPPPLDIDLDGIEDAITGFGEEGFLVYQPLGGSKQRPRLGPLTSNLKVRTVAIPSTQSEDSFKFVSVRTADAASIVSYQHGQFIDVSVYEPGLSSDTIWTSKYMPQTGKLAQVFATPRQSNIIFYPDVLANQRHTLEIELTGVKAIEAIDSDHDDEIDRIAVLDSSGVLDIYQLLPGPILNRMQRIQVPSDTFTIECVEQGDGLRMYMAGTDAIYYADWQGQQFNTDLQAVESLDDTSWQRPLPANIIIYDYQRQEILHRHFLPPTDSMCFALSQDGTQLATASIGPFVRYGEALGQLNKSVRVTREPKHAVVYSRDLKRMCIAVGDILWFADPNTQRLYKIGKSHDNSVQTITPSPSGRYFASGSDDLCIYLWDPVTGQPIRSFVGHRNPPKYIAFSPDERWIASAEAQGTIKIWDCQTGGELLELRDYKGPLRGLIFNQDEKGNQTLVALGLYSELLPSCVLHEWTTADHRNP